MWFGSYVHWTRLDRKPGCCTNHSHLGKLRNPQKVLRSPQKVPRMLPWHLSAEMPACAVRFAPPNVYTFCSQPVPVCHIHTVTLACAVMHINTALKRGGCSFYFCVRLRVHHYPAAVFLSTALRKHAGQLFRPSSVWWEKRINTCLIE